MCCIRIVIIGKTVHVCIHYVHILNYMYMLVHSCVDAESTDGEGGESVRLRTGSGGRLERRKGLRKKYVS